jgi:hypothetical protein
VRENSEDWEQVWGQFSDQALRQSRDPALATLGASDAQTASWQVDVLDAQVERLAINELAVVYSRTLRLIMNGLRQESRLDFRALINDWPSQKKSSRHRAVAWLWRVC